MIFGSPAVFTPNYPGMICNGASAVGFYDLDPLRRTLERLVDFELLNHSPLRFSVVAVDLETGDEVLFDTREGWIGPEHVTASCALIPEFRPLEIEGRLLGDGGLMANLPLNVVLRDPDRNGLCIAVDPFSSQGRRFTTIAEAAVRQRELMFASQSRWFLEAYEREDRLRSTFRAALDLIPDGLEDRPEVQAARAEAERPCPKIVRLVWGSGHEIGNGLYDYSDRAVVARWEAGERAAAAALRELIG